MRCARISSPGGRFARPAVRVRPATVRAASVAKPRPLLLDNYDSYSYNLYQILAEVYGVEPLVYYNDQIDINGLATLAAEGAFDHLVISPGPGHPAVPKDIGVCMSALHELPDTPILGVCLGMQALGHSAGGNVVRAPAPIHGRLSRLRHSGHPLFAGIPKENGLDVVRYHSLVVDAASLPADLEPIAWTTGEHHAVQLGGSSDSAAAAAAHAAAGQRAQQEPGLIMGLAHRSRPHMGVQFHPESVATRYGVQIFANFKDIATAHQQKQQGHKATAAAAASPRAVVNGEGPPGRPFPARENWLPLDGISEADGTARRSKSSVVGSMWHEEDAAATEAWPPTDGLLRLRLCWRKLPGKLDAAGGGKALFEELVGPKEDTFWLDSAATDRARFSYMGARGGPLWCRVTYALPDPAAIAAGATPAASNGTRNPEIGTITITKSDGTATEETGVSSIWAYLQHQMDRVRLDASALIAETELPFDLWGGFVGCLGYELRAEAEGGRCGTAAETPDAAFFFADRIVIADHQEGDVYCLALAPAYEAGADGRPGIEQAVAEAEAWLDQTAATVEAMAASGMGSSKAAAEAQQPVASDAAPPAPFVVRDGRDAYVAAVAGCKEALVAGESYELCMTTALRQPASVCPWKFYESLRSLNPAPYAAWMAIGEGSGRWAQPGQPPAADAATGGPWRGGPVTICCSSPERFLRGGRGGGLEAKPIKGTARRALDDPAADAALAAALRASEKERAENLMIVDLLRNDLGRVCEVGSVHVPGLIEVESYATVHQLVSTVRGLRRADVSAVEAARAAFPGGSMTGAPKLRSMQLLENLEGTAPRGVYSGALGFFSVNSTFDLNIVIRTAVYAGGAVSIGAGGAITVQSDANAEYDEMRLKASALVRAMGAAQGLSAAAAERNVIEAGAAAPAADSTTAAPAPAAAAAPSTTAAPALIPARR